MTVKLSISVPDDIAAWLNAQGNVSGAITEVVRAHLAGRRTDEVLRRAGFEPTELGRQHWRDRLARPIPAAAVDAGRDMIGRRSPSESAGG